MYWQRGRLIFGAELGGREKLVLLTISDHLGSNASAWPSVPRLAKRCGLARATILRSLKLMEKQGAITVTRIVGSSNRYQISIEWLTANQSQCDTSLTVTPVSERHPPSITVTPPPKEIRKGIKRRRSRRQPRQHARLQGRARDSLRKKQPRPESWSCEHRSRRSLSQTVCLTATLSSSICGLTSARTSRPGRSTRARPLDFTRRC